MKFLARILSFTFGSAIVCFAIFLLYGAVVTLTQIDLPITYAVLAVLQAILGFILLYVGHKLAGRGRQKKIRKTVELS